MKLFGKLIFVRRRSAKIFLVVAMTLGLAWTGTRLQRDRAIETNVNLPPELSTLKNQKPGRYVSKVGDLPPSVVGGLKTFLSEEELAMADAGGPWNATDVVTDRSLPFRRLIWATEVNQRFVVHYEMGGIGHSFHFVVFSPEREGHRVPEWAGSGESGAAWSVASFAKAVAAGKIFSHPALMH